MPDSSLSTNNHPKCYDVSKPNGQQFFFKWAQPESRPRNCRIGPKWALEGFWEDRKLRYRFWTRNDSFLYSADFTIIEESENTILFLILIQEHKDTNEKNIWAESLKCSKSASTNIFFTFFHWMMYSFAQDPLINVKEKNVSCNK
jgi:hypothetical protein